MEANAVNIQGLQKLTLLDYPEKVACTIFFRGCNLRCPFCHNASIVLPERFEGGESSKDILAFLEKRRGVLDGVCMTGGEPLLQSGLPDFLRAVKMMDYAVKLDTNGCYPARLSAYIREGLVDYVAMDVKNAPARYAETVGVSKFDIAPVNESISLLKSGTLPYEFRTTVVQELHTEKELLELGQWLCSDAKYYIQNFADSGDLIGEGFTPYSEKQLLSAEMCLKPYLPNVTIRGR